MSIAGLQAGASGLAWALNNERFSDMTLILATPGAMEEARHVREARTQQPTKKARTSLNPEQSQEQVQVQQVLRDKGGVQIKANRLALAAVSSYFRKRLEDWDSDPWTMTGADGKPLLVAGVEEEVVEAAAAVVKLIYEGVVPSKLSPTQVAKMCHVADMWGAEACIRLCFAALATSPVELLSPTEFLAVLALLPESATSSPEKESWQQVCKTVTAALVDKHKDVHKLVTDPDQLMQFQQLPFMVIKAWADSDDLVVDSEDSVAVALGWWVAGAEGSKCKRQQLKELAGLVRVQHLTAGFRLVTLRKLPWFKFWKDELDLLNVVLSTGVLDGVKHDFPDAWLSPPRKQLDASDLKQRCTISWDVPKAALEAALSNESPEESMSPSIYMAGTGVQLTVYPTRRKDDATAFGVFLQTTSYSHHDTIICEPGAALSCECEILRQALGEAQMRRVYKFQMTTTPVGVGKHAFIVASSPADLEPYLVDGHLKLKATISLVPA